MAIVGTSGSGKSTLLNVLGLLDVLTSGTYLVQGSDSAALSEKQRSELRAETFGFVFQESHMVGRDTAARNAVLGLRARGVKFRVQEDLVGPTLDQFGLGHRASTPAAKLSGGERQRLAIVRAVIGKPKVILADEPTGSLDTKNGKIVLGHLRDLHAQGTTVVMVTHDTKIAASADRIITMRDGRIVGDTGLAARTLDIHQTASRASTLARRFWAEASDVVADALSSLTVRPAKAVLLTLAFLLGSAGLVAAIGLSESAATGVSMRIDAAASDEVRTTREDGYTSWDQVSSDLEIARSMTGVVGAGIVADLSTSKVKPTLFAAGTTPSQPVFRGGVRIADSGYLRIMQARVTGADTSLLDNSFGRPVALVGAVAATELGISRPGPGVVLWLYNQPVPVVGIISDPGLDPVLSGSIVVGTDSYAISEQRMAATLVLRTEPGMPAAVAGVVPKALSPEDVGNIRVETVADLRDLKAGINSDLGRLVAIVSAILLAVACLSAGTTMYLGVLARSSEIALRRALGMRKTALALMFLTEGGLVGLIGGAAGGAVGMAAVLVYAANESWIPVIPWYAALLGACVGVVSGTLSALYPAIVASRANPAQLIRG